MSGNTDFWHNDLFTRIGHPFLGNNLFGAERPISFSLLMVAVALSFACLNAVCADVH